MSMDGRVTYVRDGAVGRISFDRPAALNAMTPTMYEEFGAACLAAAADTELRVVVLRGIGGKSFVAGSDISQFLSFETPEDGVAYERAMEAHLAALLSIEVPVVAMIEGYAVGGGLNIAACSDIRLATPGTRFGVPIARTVGNCLAMSNYARLVAGFGEGRAKRMLLLGEMLDAGEAVAAGFVSRIVPEDKVEETLANVVERIAGNAPITLKVSKAALARIATLNVEGEDLIRRAYGSEDFRTGVRAFVDKSKPEWKGR
jgi:enoyl-CoA hydratase